MACLVGSKKALVGWARVRIDGGCRREEDDGEVGPFFKEDPYGAFGGQGHLVDEAKIY